MKSKLLLPFFIGLVVMLLAYGAYQALFAAPTEETMGDVQRIFYYHVPSAWTAMILFLVNFCASAVYFFTRSPKADAWALTAAEVGVVFCTVVLITGPIWARPVWGIWWTWDLRLTTTLIMWLLYVSYLILRRSSEPGSSSTLATVFALSAAVDIPIVWMAIRWYSVHTQHPQPVFGNGPNSGLDPQMKVALFANWFAFMAFAALIFWIRYSVERTTQKVATAFVQKASRRTAVVLGMSTLLFFQSPVGRTPDPRHIFLYSAYAVTWIIHISYFVIIGRKIARLKEEQAELKLT
ncbi:MAG TPA: cytochrome c biogenesis protein [Candidatus Angelobacter sp.]|jgi:heme exporter protein C|nr:cytochrome c biogenesis protein [Candidatus Angelobacter sp.]